MEQYKLKKDIWTEKDFDEMVWHDATVYGFSILPEKCELALDIDYIFDWIKPRENETYFKFLASPTTLVFENVNELSINIGEPYRTIQIHSIERSDERKPKNADYIMRDIEWKWVIDLEIGEVSFYSIGYKQFIRKNPILSNTQSLRANDGSEISFFRGIENSND